mmetsp:Transcript_27371/g.37752  ORF Transcript_27371/g.37752 Transcript_27371/m.37752 type:complete len:617 (+) Transcript_27371:3-1853(+)
MTPPCPAPDVDGRECSGRGTCWSSQEDYLPDKDDDDDEDDDDDGDDDDDDNDDDDNNDDDGNSVSLAESCQSAVCRCQSSWGDIGCNQFLKYLPFGVSSVTESLTIHGWAYYEINVERKVSALLVELRRYSGDPVLFVKPKYQGYVPGGVPTISDFEQFADVEGFRSRLNYHFRLLLNVEPGVYYVAVFNNDAYLKDTSSYNIQALIPPLYPTGIQICPNNCSWPQGSCWQTEIRTQENMCACESGFAGYTCEGPLVPLRLGTTYQGELSPGRWMFFQFSLTSKKPEDTSVKKGLSVSLYKIGGFPDLVIKKSSYPRLMESDFKFKTGKEYESESHFRIKSSELSPGEYFVGIYNTDYDVHSLCEFRLHIVFTDEDSFMFNPTMSIVLGVLCTMFLCLMLSLCKKVVYRNLRLHSQRHLQTTSGAVDPNLPGVRSVWGNAENPGLDLELVTSFPTFVWDEGKLEKDDPQCSVCLGDYESSDSELLRRLPACMHAFHQPCIDRWLLSHTTCPLCRLDLSPSAQQETADVDLENPVATNEPGSTAQEEQNFIGVQTPSFGVESVHESESIAPGYGNAPISPIIELEMSVFSSTNPVSNDLHLSENSMNHGSDSSTNAS